MPGKVRVEWNSSNDSTVRPEAIEDQRRKGFDVRIEITRFDRKVRYTIYPRRRSYFEEPLRPGISVTESTTASATEELAGHRYRKRRFRIGTSEEMIAWEAIDLDGFPIGIRTIHGDFISDLRFEKVRKGEIAPAMFEPPPGFRRFDDLFALLRADGGHSAD